MGEPARALKAQGLQGRTEAVPCTQRLYEARSCTCQRQKMNVASPTWLGALRPLRAHSQIQPPALQSFCLRMASMRLQFNAC